MNTFTQPYGKLCSLFYDMTKTYASKAEVDFYASYIDRNPGRVLEAMSGSGRLQIPLLQRGYCVDGVDNSVDMLDRCRVRCTQLNLKPDLYEQSLEQLDLPYTYKTVIIAVGSFQLITEHALALQALRNIHTHMDAKGILLLDIFVPDTRVDRRSVQNVLLDKHTVIRLTTRHLFYEQQKKAEAFCTYALIRDGVVQKEEYELMTIVWRTDDEWQQLLYSAGFEIVTIHDMTVWVSDKSRVICAQKRGGGDEC